MSTTALQFVITARDNASKTLEGIGKSAQNQASKFENFRAKANIALAAVGVVVAKVASDSVSAASDLSETLNKANVIFGDNASAVEKWADSAATSVGLSKAAALEAAASYGNMFQQLGFGGQQATDLSTSVVKLAADLGSFNNLGTDEVMDKLSGAFRGEYDSLQALIPNINAARVEQEALAATGKKSASDLTAAEKASATLAIVQRDGAAAANDFAETSGGLANQQKIAAAEAADLSAKFGTQLLPVVTKLTSIGTSLLGWLNRTPGAMTAITVVLGVATAAWVAMNIATTGVTKAQLAWTNAQLVWQKATKIGTAIQAAFNGVLAANPIGLVVLAIAALVAGLTLFFTKTELGKKIWAGFTGFLSSAWNNTVGWIKGGVDNILAFFRALPDNIGNVLRTVANVITFPFRTAFNALANIWNNGPGRISVAIPSWVPVVGGKTFSVPKLPTIPAFATGVSNYAGGYALVGEEGPEVVRLPRGSDVYPTGVNPAGGNVYNYNIYEATSAEATAKQVHRLDRMQVV